MKSSGKITSKSGVTYMAAHSSYSTGVVDADATYCL